MQFRFGVVLISTGCTRAQWVEKCRTAEALGYDVIAVSDHLNLLSPFPSAMLAAEVTERPRIGTYVLNTSFYNGALLARDVATTDQLTGGRLELGLGTGYVRPEFDAAGIPFGTAATRADRLEAVLDELDAFFARDGVPGPVQRPGPPLLIGGHGERLLRLAARRAGIVSFTGAPYRTEYGRTALVDAAELLQRVKLVRAEAGARAGGIEFNVLSKGTVLTGDRRSGVERLRRYGPDLTTGQLLELPMLFVGTVGQVAEQIREHAETFGFTYYTVMESAMTDFGRVIEAVREVRL